MTFFSFDSFWSKTINQFAVVIQKIEGCLSRHPSISRFSFSLFGAHGRAGGFWKITDKIDDSAVLFLGSNDVVDSASVRGAL